MQFRRSGQRDERRRRVLNDALAVATPGSCRPSRRSAWGSERLAERKSENYGDAAFMDQQPCLTDLVPRHLAVFVLVLAAVLVRRAHVRLGGRKLAIVLAVGLGDALGNLLFAASSGRGLVSLTSVLASLYPVITVVLAAIVVGERVSRLQQLGIGLTIAGITLIAT